MDRSSPAPGRAQQPDLSLASHDEFSATEYYRFSNLHHDASHVHRRNNHQHHMQHDTSFTHDHHTHQVVSKIQHDDNDTTYGHHAHYYDDSGDGDDDNLERNKDENDEEGEEIVSKQVSLFSLFKYSNAWDMVLVFLGCIGALINGGSLPWYSHLFGNFIDKIAKDSVTDKDKMMRDVHEVFTIYNLMQ